MAIDKRTKNTGNYKGLYPKPSNGKKYSDEENAAISLLNDLAKEGVITTETIPALASFYWQRLEDEKLSYKLRGPDDFGPTDLINSLFAANEAISSTIYTQVENRILMLSTATGEIVHRGEKGEKVASDTDYGFYAELLAEILLLISSAFGGPKGKTAKKAAVDTAKELAERESVREILKRIWRAIIPRVSAGGGALTPTAGESLKILGKELWKLIKELGSSIKDFFKKLFESLSGWGIALLLLEILIMFTPLGWAKKGLSFAAGLIGLTGSIISKLDSQPQPA
jgi:hypothetical protein